MRWHVGILAAVVLIAGLASGSAMAEGGPDIDKLIRERVDGGYTVGVVMAVVKPDGTKFHSYGTVKEDVPDRVGPHTLYKLGDITKVFTALLLTDMVRRGEVGLNDPISKHLPEQLRIPSRDGRTITLAQLATHTSSLPELPEKLGTWSHSWDNYTDGQMYDFIMGFEPAYAPGSQWKFSHLGYGLLGHIMKRKTGKDFELLLGERVLSVLGLDGTYLTQNADLQARSAYGHRSDAEIKNWNTPMLTPAGGGWSSARDLATFLSVCLGFKKSEMTPAVNALVELQTTTGTGSIEQALGWKVATHYGEPIYFADSGRGGYRCFIAFSPARKIGIVGLSNSAIGISDVCLHAIDSQYAIRSLKAVASTEPGKLDDYVGRYVMKSGLVFLFTRDGDKLMVEQAGVDKLEVVPEAADIFRYKMIEASFRFERDEAGRVSNLALRQGKWSQRGRKIAAKEEPVEIEMSEGMLGRYEGKYRADNGMTFMIWPVGDKLFCQLEKEGAPKLRIYPKAKNEFFYRLVFATITFNTDEVGTIQGLTLHMDDQEIVAERMILMDDPQPQVFGG